MASNLNKLARRIGQRIRALRYERGWKQVDLEAHLDDRVKRAVLSLYETGQRLPSMTALAQLADAFEVPEAALLLDPDDERQRAAMAVLACSKAALSKIKKILDAEDS